MNTPANNFAGRVGRCIVLLVVVTAAGCQQAGEIFPAVDPPVQWPPATQPARIRYVGQLASDTDLKPAKNFLEGLGEAIFGKKDISTVLTPFGVCTDGGNRLFVADSGAQMVHVFDLQTRKYAHWKPAEPDRFTQPVGVAWHPAGRLYVSDSVGQAVFIFDSDGKSLGRLGQNQITRPVGIAIDRTNKRIYVSDTAAHMIMVFNDKGELQQRIGRRGAGLGEFNFPRQLAVDSKGRLYVSDSMNFRVQQFGLDLKPIRQIGKLGDSPGYFGNPVGVAIDGDDHLYVADAHFETVQIFDDQGQLLLYFGQEGDKPGEFGLPAGLFIDAKNRIWVADRYNRRIQVFDYIPEAKP